MVDNDPINYFDDLGMRKRQLGIRIHLELRRLLVVLQMSVM